MLRHCCFYDKQQYEEAVQHLLTSLSIQESEAELEGEFGISRRDAAK